jgi:hypothetical protein
MYSISGFSVAYKNPTAQIKLQNGTKNTTLKEAKRINKIKFTHHG